MYHNRAIIYIIVYIYLFIYISFQSAPHVSVMHESQSYMYVCIDNSSQKENPVHKVGIAFTRKRDIVKYPSRLTSRQERI